MWSLVVQLKHYLVCVDRAEHGERFASVTDISVGRYFCTVEITSKSSFPFALKLNLPSHTLQLSGSSWFSVDYLKSP